MTETEAQMLIRLSGPGWQAELAVAAPDSPSWRLVQFAVASSDPADPRHAGIDAGVRYTEAENRLDSGWPRWHVKVYRCFSAGDAEQLRMYLRRQAFDIQQANAQVPGAHRIPVQPPWAVVPVQIVRCDGQEYTTGMVRTELALPTGPVIDDLRRRLPSWLDDDPPTPEQYLLAISPYMERLHWDERRGTPGTEHLADFLGMAAGLDALHRLGTVHCDIKPDNVCRYGTYELSGYVLIDADAATQTDPVPAVLRTTPLYEYGGITRWRYTQPGRRRPIGAALLKAHDRFGFAVVVLVALAGRDWVEQVLLRRVDDRPGGSRAVDDRTAVASALRQLWIDGPDRRWQPLIDALVEPFGGEVESVGWSARAWIERLCAAERECVLAPPAADALRHGPVHRYRAELARIRHEALSVPSRRPDVAQRGFEAVESVARRVALRAAIGSLLLWLTIPTVLTALAMAGVLWLGK